MTEPTLIESIVTALSLMELLDSAHKTEKLGTIAYSEYHKQHGITNHELYSLDDGAAGHVHVWIRDKAYEIHHAVGELENEISGDWLPSGKHNARFAGTMYMIAKKILNSGHRVRIVGNHTNGMFQHYNKIANILAKREKYSVSIPTQYKLDSPKSKDYSEITISRYNKNSPLYEMMISRTKSHTKKNNYGLDYATPKKFDSIDEMMDDYFNGHKHEELNIVK